MENIKEVFEKYSFLQSEALDLEWQVGFRDRGIGRGDHAVICNWKGQKEPTLIVECPCREIAEHIVNVHNQSLVR